MLNSYRSRFTGDSLLLCQEWQLPRVLELAARKATDLIGIWLNRSSPFGANLRGIRLAQADLQDSDLREVDFSCADLRHADLRGCCLIGTRLEGARLEGAILDRGVLPDG